MRPTDVTRTAGWVCAGMALALLVAGCAILPPGPVITPTRTQDPDYDFGADQACTTRLAGPQTSAPYPPDSLIAVGTAAEARIARLEVPQPAQQENDIAGKQSRGVWVVVQIAEQYVGTSVFGLPARPQDFQLIDPHGAVHCMIASPTKALNQPAFPDLKDVFFWQIPLLPNQPSTVFWLAFDVEPELVAGSYLLASNMTRTESVNLDLGLT